MGGASLGDDVVSQARNYVRDDASRVVGMRTIMRLPPCWGLSIRLVPWRENRRAL